MNKLTKIIQDIINNPDTIIIVLTLCIASFILCKMFLKDLKKKAVPSFSSIIFTCICLIVWILSFANYGERGNKDFFVYYSWIFVWPLPVAFIINKYLNHISLYGFCALISRNGFWLPLNLYDFLLRFSNSHISTNFYIPDKIKFAEANSLFSRYEKSKDEGLFHIFVSCIRAYEIPMEYFWISRKKWKEEKEQKVVRY